MAEHSEVSTARKEGHSGLIGANQRHSMWAISGEDGTKSEQYPSYNESY